MEKFEQNSNEVMSSSNLEGLKGKYKDLYKEWRMGQHIFTQNVLYNNTEEGRKNPRPLIPEDIQEVSKSLGKIVSLQEELEKQGVDIQSINNEVNTEIENSQN